MGNLSSKPKAKNPVISSKDKSILELKVNRDKLKQYEKKLKVIIDREIEVAKHHLQQKNHHAARLALSKKKYQEHLLEKTGAQLLNLEQLTMTIEYALVEQDVIKGLEKGNEALKLINAEMDINKVEKLMEDTEDAIAYQNEIQELLSGQLDEKDESEIMEELDKLLEQEVQEKILDLPSAPEQELPEISSKTKDPSKAKTKTATANVNEPLLA